MKTEIIVLHYENVVPSNWNLMLKAAQKRNIQLTSWQPHKINLYCKDKKYYPLYDGKIVNPKVILHRSVFPFSGVVLPALNYWSGTGTVVLNAPDYAYRSRDKLLTTIDLCNAGIPFVPTLGFIKSADNDLSVFGDTEIIIKPAHGVRGEGVEHYSSSKDAVFPMDIYNSHLPLEHFLQQPYINTGGCDLRAFVVNGKCIAIIQRQSQKGEIRANMTLGAVGKTLPNNHPAGRIAIAAIKACNLDYGGVDMIEDKNGNVLVLEVDAWAGFAGITAVTGEDVAGAIIDLAINKLKEEKSK